MFQPHSGKAVANENKYPIIVEIAVAAADQLDVEFSRHIMHFHMLRHIQPRHGRRIVKGGQIYYRWCFSDLATAHAFTEKFGGELFETSVVN
jgi:hypothetical protein